MMTDIVPDAPRAAASILIVDDDPDMREGLCDVLGDEGYRVTSATDGADAVRCIHEAALPDLIVIDLRMPIMDGYEFLRLRFVDQALRQIPVIVVSATLDKRIDDPGVEVMRKPVELETLLRLVRRQLECPRA
jgi:CheY-like chemotaxis protein